MKIVDKIARLIDVKSLVTLALVLVLCIMTVWGKETGEIFNSAVMLVLGFFFGKVKSAEGGQLQSTEEQKDAGAE